MPFFYLPTQQARVSLTTYKYNGTDNSPIYNYVLSPLANFLVETLTPRYIAPNAITLLGLCFMLTSFIIFWYYCPMLNYGEAIIEAPRWIFAFNGAAMLIYQTLDNMDGKQARKTGSSSPLGMLFDHGCDAINVTLGVSNWLCVVCCYPNEAYRVIIGAISPSVPMFMSTWEEYYTHELYLPSFNGPTEGVLMGACLSFIAAICGPAIFREYTIYEYLVEPYTIPYLMFPRWDNSEFLVFASIVLSCKEAISKSIHVSSKYGLSALLDLLPFIVHVNTFIAFASHPNKDLFQRHPRIIIVLFGAILVEMVTQLMMDHMSRQKFNRLRWPLIPMILFLLTSEQFSLESKEMFLFCYTTALITFLACKIRLVIHEYCVCLKVLCFDIVTPYSVF